MSTVFIVATPIGNLGDLSPRALEVLRGVDLIACEDTRHSIKLLNHFQLQKPLESYHDFNEATKAEELVRRIEGGLKVALISDAGTPGISDPGYRLIRMCRERGIEVIGIPGPCAAVVALSTSGLPSDEFLFVGFLPVKAQARREKLEALKPGTATLICYESPHRILETLREIASVLGDREVCLGRELTKLHEEYLFGKLSTVIDRVKPVGEFVLVIAGGDGEHHVATTDLEGLSRKDVLKFLAEKTGIPKNKLYEILLKD